MKPVTWTWKDGRIAIRYQHNPNWIVFELGDKANVKPSYDLEHKAQKLVDLWNSSEEDDSWEVHSLSMMDIIEVCVDNDIPIPSQDDIPTIVGRYQDVCRSMMEDWQTYLAEIMKDL